MLCIYIHKLPCTCSVFMFTHSWLMRDPSIVHLNTRCFIHCLCYLELGVLQQLKLLQWLGMIHRSQIVYESSSSHHKIKNNAFCFAAGLPLVCENFPVIVEISLFVLHTHILYLSLVGCHEGIHLFKWFTIAFTNWSL